MESYQRAALEKLENSKIRKILITDTIEISNQKNINKIEIISVSKVFAEAVKRVHNGESVSALFDF